MAEPPSEVLGMPLPDLPMLSTLIYLCLGLIAVSLLMMVGFGLTHTSRLGGDSKLTAAAFLMPVAIFAIVYAVNSGHDSPLVIATVVTAVVMALSGLAALLISGLRGLVR